jgi:hypothetical protein
MDRSAQRRGRVRVSRNKRIAVVATVLVAFGALLTVSRVSSAKEQRPVASSAKCGPSVPGANAPDGQSMTTSQQNGRTVRNYWGDGQQPAAGCVQTAAQGQGQGQAQAQTVSCPSVADKVQNVPAAKKAQVDRNLALLEEFTADANNRLAAARGQGGQNFIDTSIMAPLKTNRTAIINEIKAAMGDAAAKQANLDPLVTCTLKAAANNGGRNNNGGNYNAGNNNAGNNNGGQNNNGNNNNAGNNGGGLNILADKCQGGSKLTAHDGFQNGNRCVDTQMGEVGDASKNPSLLITQAPQTVKPNQAFTLRVSTRNLIRDRFLAAAQGGYYVEMSLLNNQGLVRGHFHTACRMLDSTNAAPDPAPAPAFFVATEDGGGSNRADQIEIRVPGLPQKGTAQCMSWAGDGSHRIPMMQRANQIPAADTVRITVE